MNLPYQIKHQLKLIRWQGRRSMASLRWGASRLNNTPAVLGNAMPKSGSHLIIQVLQGLAHIGPFINPGLPPVNRGEDNSLLSESEVLANIRNMKPGDIGYGYIQARQPFIEPLTAPGRATVFVYRDPRDMVISHVFYATEIHPGHNMHSYYTEVLQNMEERINAAICGVDEPGSELSGVCAKYEKYLDWLNQPAMLSLRFEDLILKRDEALSRLLDYLELRGFKSELTRSQAIEGIKEAIAPRRSGTFRKGKPGNWQEYFTPANKSIFKRETGDLLIRMGYEENERW
jgi:sulfotransferase 6B1